MSKTFALASSIAASLLLAAPPATAQQIGVVLDAEGCVDSAEVGWAVYRGVPFPPWSGYFLLCDDTSASGDLVPAGEIAEDVHMLNGGDLAAITFTYRVWSASRGGSGPPSGTATAVLNVYDNDPDDTLLPSATTLLETWTIPLEWEDDVWYVVTFEIPEPRPVVGRDLWVGVQIVDSGPGTAGGLGGKGALSTEPGAIVLGESHNVTWIGASACEPLPRLVKNFDEFGIVGNYGIDVRVFPTDDCQFPVDNGDFESGTLGPWSAGGRAAVVTAEQVELGTASGSYQAAITNGDEDGDFWYGNEPLLPWLVEQPLGAAGLEGFLGLAPGTLDTVAAPGNVVEGSAVQQTLSVTAGDRLRFRWNFLTNEDVSGFQPPITSSDYNDFAFLSVATGSSQTAIVLADIFHPALVDSWSVHSLETGYVAGEYTFTTSGTVTIGFGVVDQGDDEAESSLLIDCVELLPGVGNNVPPSCTVDLDAARADFLETSPGSFVVTAGRTIETVFEATDANGDLLTATWTGLPAGATLSPTSGTAPLASQLSWTPTFADRDAVPYIVTVTFRDSGTITSTCGVTIEDVNLDPECSLAGVSVETDDPQGALVTLAGSISDPDDGDPLNELAFTWFVPDGIVLDDPASLTPTALFPLGSTEVQLCVVDGRGGWSQCTAMVTVSPPGTERPEVVCSTDLAALWPPKHGMYPVTLTVSATQGETDLPITVAVRSSEPDDEAGSGDGQTTGDVHGSDGYSAPVDVTPEFSFDALTGLWTGTVLLRAERSGSGVGRQYTFEVSATGTSGDLATTSCCVIVPHDRRKSTAP